MESLGGTKAVHSSSLPKPSPVSRAHDEFVRGVSNL
jgi:hypothetical protein